jgi:hypothetical protein
MSPFRHASPARWRRSFLFVGASITANGAFPAETWDLAREKEQELVGIRFA